MRFFAILVLCGLLQAQTPAPKPAVKTATASSIDVKQIEELVRYLNVYDASITVSVSTPVDSKRLPGFKEVTVVASRDKLSLSQLYYVSADGQHVVQGEVYDTKKAPFAATLALLKTANLPSFGAPGAPVEIVLFSDFQCPVCKQEADVIRRNLTSAYPKEVRVFFNNFPLEAIHPWARSAAVAGRCVFAQDAAKFWGFHDAMFVAQESLNQLNLREKTLEWVKANGLDEARYTTCYDTAATNAEVERELTQGRALGVDATPTLFINGRKVPRALPWEQLKFLIDFELKATQTAAAKPNDKECCELKLGGVK